MKNIEGEWKDKNARLKLVPCKETISKLNKILQDKCKITTTQETFALMGLGNIEKALGENDDANQYFREAAVIYQALGMAAEMEMAVANIGRFK